MKREQQQVLVNTNGSDDGADSVISLTSVGSTLRSMLRNRSRRSSSDPDISSNKNTTMVVSPTLVNSKTSKVSESKRLLIKLMTSFTSITPPYLILPPINWEKVDDLFT